MLTGNGRLPEAPEPNPLRPGTVPARKRSSRMRFVPSGTAVGHFPGRWPFYRLRFGPVAIGATAGTYPAVIPRIVVCVERGSSDRSCHAKVLGRPIKLGIVALNKSNLENKPFQVKSNENLTTKKEPKASILQESALALSLFSFHMAGWLFFQWRTRSRAVLPANDTADYFVSHNTQENSCRFSKDLKPNKTIQNLTNRLPFEAGYTNLQATSRSTI
ncbi:hypothetical protein GWI33_019647 [Rhynchophorus ferrugineus]|uniref:Uncharacterized protein n=1 Tax=Rhynchophorus ferrugineus TaxID=354439 RepID=A0A834HSB4_RHYFE|nr:hypothetical protein GWI33_019647 [Rhynchophorus ferrugineus]